MNKKQIQKFESDQLKIKQTQLIIGGHSDSGTLTVLDTDMES